MTDAETALHYTWRNGCDGWHLVRSEHLSVIQERMPPGTSEIRHFHRRTRQFFFVLSGELTIETAMGTERLRVRQGLEVAPGEPHLVSNAGPEAAEFLVVSQPPSHDDRVQVE